MVRPQTMTSEKKKIPALLRVNSESGWTFKKELTEHCVRTALDLRVLLDPTLTVLAVEESVSQSPLFCLPVASPVA